MNPEKAFNAEMTKYFANNQSEIAMFFNNKFRDSRQNSYLNFFEAYLFKFGIISFGYTPLFDGKNFIPYINCTQNNIFKLKAGVTKLSSNPLNSKDCNKILAKYLIENINPLQLKSIINCNPANNQN